MSGEYGSNISYPYPGRFQRTFMLIWGLFLLIIFGLVLDLIRIPFQPPVVPRIIPVWGEKPVLGYILFTPSLAGRLQEEGVFSAKQLQAVQMIARRELDQLNALEARSMLIIQDPQLTLQQKREAITRMGYNQQVDRIVETSQRALQNSLDPKTYSRFVTWTESQWARERQLHGIPAKNNSPRTYSIFATRYDSKGAYTVALPDKCVKFANAGNHTCDEDGYAVGQDYTVYLSYKKGTAVRVLESGPWNVDDNYWSRASDPQPRRMFRDLGLGIPEAQAAYFNSYNGGKDQFGRKVTAPYGIDLARQVSIDIGLLPGVNDWINISFMWTEGWDNGTVPTSKPGATSIQTTTQPTVGLIRTSTPNSDGSVIHVVQPGQALWNIAAAYNVTLQQILDLNDITKDSFIFPGQKLMIKPASGSSFLTGTFLPTGSSSVKGETHFINTLTETVSTRTSQQKSATSLPTLTQTSSFPTPIPTFGANSKSLLQTDPMLLGIFALLVIGAALVLSGTLIKRNR